MKLTSFEIKNDHIMIKTDIGSFSGKDTQIQNEVTKIVEKLADKYKAYFEIMVNSDSYSDPKVEDKCESCKIPEEVVEVKEETPKKKEEKKVEEPSDDLELTI